MMNRIQFITLSTLLALVFIAVAFNVYVGRYSYITIGDDTIKYDRIKNEYFILGISKGNYRFKQESLDKLTNFYDTELQFHKLERLGDEE